MFWCVSYYLGAFGTFFCPTTLRAKRVNWCNCSCHKVVLEFFATNAPDPPHWTLNFCFRAICTILVHLGLFGCLIKLGAERAEVVQRSCHEVASEFFAIKAPDPTHWTLNSRFGAFRTIWVHLGLFGCRTTLSAKTGQTGAKLHATKTRWNFSNEHPRSTPLDPKLMFWCVSYYLGAFETIWLP